MSLDNAADAATVDTSTDDAIATQTSKLLQAYGEEALMCFKTLSGLLQTKLKESTPKTTSQQPQSLTAEDYTDNAVTPTTTADLPSLVLQTLRMEESSSSETIEPFMEAGIQVLRYWFCLQTETQQQQIQSSTTVLLDLLCENMTKFPQNASLQEAACVTLSQLLSNHLLAVLSSPHEQEQQFQRILFPVLQAMNWHRHNVALWNAGMVVLTRLLSPTPTSTLTSRQTQAMSLLELTGGVTILFEAMMRRPTQQQNQLQSSNSDKQLGLQLKSNVCEALAALCLNHPTNQALIASHPFGFSNLMDTMTLYAHHLPLQASLLQLLASLAYGQDSKTVLLEKGGLDGILTCLKEHPMHAHLQATGCRAMANLFAGTSPELRSKKGSLCIKPLLRAMRTHPPRLIITEEVEDSNGDDDLQSKTTTTTRDNPNVAAAQIHFYGCAALRNLSKVHSHAVVEAGGIATLLVTLREYKARPAIQEQAWGAIYLLLQPTATMTDSTGGTAAGAQRSSITSRSENDIAMSFVTEGGLESLLETLRRYATHPRIQLVGLGCLAYLSETKSLQERIVSEQALDLVLAALYRFHTNKKPPQPNKQQQEQHPPPKQQQQAPNFLLLQHGCRVLANVSEENYDYQLAVIVKNGINVCLMILQQPQLLHHVGVQSAACETICNVARNSDNLIHLEQQGGSSKSLIPTLLMILSKHRGRDQQQQLQQHHEFDLILCLLELLGYLATVPSMQVELVGRKGLDLVVEILREHQQQPLATGSSSTEQQQERRLSASAAETPSLLLLERGVIFLSHLSANYDATLWMKRHDMIPWLQGIESSFARRSEGRATIRSLIQHLQSARVFLAKFGGSLRKKKVAG